MKPQTEKVLRSAEKVVLAPFIGCCRISDHRRLVLCLDCRFGYRKTGRIANDAEKFGAARLGESKFW